MLKAKQTHDSCSHPTSSSKHNPIRIQALNWGLQGVTVDCRAGKGSGGGSIHNPINKCYGLVGKVGVPDLRPDKLVAINRVCKIRWGGLNLFSL